MATVNFYYRSKKPESTLTLRLLFGNNQPEARTRHFVSKVYWNEYHQAKRIKNAEMKAMQAQTLIELSKLSSFVLQAFYQTPKEYVNKTWLSDIVESYYQPQESVEKSVEGLIDALEAYLEYKGNDLKLSTRKKYGVVKNMLLRFQSSVGKKLFVRDINLDFKRDFEKYCMEQEYAVNTIAKAFKIVKTVCKYARKRGVQISEELADVKLKTSETQTVYLSLDDLGKIEKIKGLPDYLDNARDWLLISCYTGQRISDFMRFHSEMITRTKGKNNKPVWLLEFTQSKTGSPISIPLSNEVNEILAKRNGQFPRPIADQVYNRFIKDVCKLAGLTYQCYGSKKIKVSEEEGLWRKKEDHYEKWELVTSHIGRRSFATNNYGNIPTSFLAYATGHKSEEMFLKYMRKNQKDIALELAEYFQK